MVVRMKERCEALRCRLVSACRARFLAWGLLAMCLRFSILVDQERRRNMRIFIAKVNAETLCDPDTISGFVIGVA